MKKTHIAIAVWIVIFKILVISSLIYIAFILIEIRTDLELTRATQIEIETQIDTNQKSMQSQITEISSSLLATKNTLNEEIAKLRADTSADFSGIIAQVIPSVVSIGTDVSQGSGFIIAEEGFVITNAHVLNGASYIRILNYESDEWVEAEFIGWDQELDIAVLKIPGNNFDYLEFEDSDDIKVGEKVIALGNPLGLSFSVSEGIISALNRRGPNNIEAYIQVDTPLNPGNSGGPLVSKSGDVVGINNFKLQNSENLGFALESNTAVDSINNILELNNQTLRI